MFRLGLAPALTLTLVLLAGPAFAQQPPLSVVRGTILAVEGQDLTLDTHDGATKVSLTDKTVMTGVNKITLADIKPDAYVGVVSVPSRDGTDHAVSIHVFPPEQRGVGEGSRPWDRPGSTMTNAAIAQEVTAKDGETLTLKYGAGEKKVLVTPETSLVRFEPGASAAELKPGVRVLAFTNTPAEGERHVRRLLVVRGDFIPAL
ncbi:hypothetical protein V5F77_01420 [Xanthobacter sp. DSM 24535]|uniref:hypothetical protein n=1 Tax=Roseixanthobacter psychrophilus TaxID=3119917 RepID=UPI00372B18B2